jgi:hypothetical protein
MFHVPSLILMTFLRFLDLFLTATFTTIYMDGTC